MSRTAILWVITGAIALALALTGHGPHVVGYLPFLILFACPLMHMFMHAGQHNRPRDRRSNSPG